MEPTHPSLVVLGATFEIKSQLKDVGITPVYVDGPVDAMDYVLEHPDALLAYAPGVFGLATSGQPVRVVSAARSLMLVARPHGEPKIVKAGEAQTFEEDPEVLAVQAVGVLRVRLILCLGSEDGRNALRDLLNGTAPEIVTEFTRSS